MNRFTGNELDRFMADLRIINNSDDVWVLEDDAFFETMRRMMRRAKKMIKHPKLVSLMAKYSQIEFDNYNDAKEKCYETDGVTLISFPEIESYWLLPLHTLNQFLADYAQYINDMSTRYEN